MEQLGHFSASDGVSVAYHHGFPQNSGYLPPVFLLHGLASDSRTSWIDTGLTETLNRAGRETFAVDLRGHGRSEKPHESARYGETRMGRDLSELWDHLEMPTVDLVGHSMGAVVALLVASSDPRVRRLVLSGVGRYQLEYTGGPLPHFDSSGYAAALTVEDENELTDPVLREFRDEVDESDNDREALAAHLRVFHKSPLPIDRIVVPTLVIAGVDDQLSPSPELLAEAIRLGIAMTIPGDHAGAKVTQTFIDAVADFLNQT